MSASKNDERTVEDLWKSVLGSVEREVAPATFKTWFKDTHVDNYERGEVIIAVPNEFRSQLAK